MVPTSLPGLLTLALLSQPPATGEECAASSALLELTETAPPQPPVVCLSPGRATTLRFDSELLPRGVRLQGREHFEDVVAGTRNVLLAPEENLVAGEHFTLEVCFADGQAPACAAFRLVMHPGLGLPEVKVTRRARQVEDYQREVREARAEVEKCQAEVAQLRARREGPEGLRGVLASGLMAKGSGITARDLTYDVTKKPGNALSTKRTYSYRTKGHVAVEVFLVNESDTPWTVEGAALRGRAGEVLKSLPPWPTDPIMPSPTKEAAKDRVVVEVLSPPEGIAGPYTLTLWDTDGQRSITLGNVTFP